MILINLFFVYYLFKNIYVRVYLSNMKKGLCKKNIGFKKYSGINLRVFFKKLFEVDSCVVVLESSFLKLII